MPDYYVSSPDDFEMTLLELEYSQKFATLQHRTILGAMVHSGLKRESFGDIVVDDNQRWQIAVSNHIAPFVQQDLTRMGRNKVKLKPVSAEQAITLVQDWVESDVTVTSLRLDTVVAQAYRLSRTQAKELIERGLVKVNWTEITQADFTIATDDLLSVRGYGRVRITQNNGITKKEKHRLTIAVIQK
ncbi:RNA-binding protein [Weissella tructae]|nr:MULTISPECIES: YlmH/Sll1252 family protein [Weissella]ELA07646.1 30S ribosomal protein S4e [Weissella ceti NC36]